MKYKKLGFKCGIEIHQQLDTHKLFCKCPSKIRKDEPDFVIKRFLRASAGESGKIDVAAKYEQEKQKQFIYQGYYDTTCLVETDDEPPGPLNLEALQTTIQIAKALNAKIVDKIQFMRKVVIDGSNTSGFQRTALIARNGQIEVDGHKVTIESICLEEEACQSIKRTKQEDTYNLSRLGIPLIEIATSPDIVNPEHCKHVAEYLGMVLRSTGKAKRGIGTIRQDVNISIKAGARTEIKGFQDLRSIPKVIEYEVNRQLSIIKKKKKPKKEVRKAEPDLTTTFLRPMPGSARMYPETDIPIIEIPKGRISKIEVLELLSTKSKSISKKFDISEEKIQKLMKSNWLELFKEIVLTNKKVKPAFVCEILLSFTKEILKNMPSDQLNVKKEHFLSIFENLNKGKISKESVMEILIDISKGKGLNLKKYELQEIDLEKEIKLIISKNKSAPIGALMGLIMKKFHGKVEGKKAMQILKKNL